MNQAILIIAVMAALFTVFMIVFVINFLIHKFIYGFLPKSHPFKNWTLKKEITIGIISLVIIIILIISPISMDTLRSTNFRYGLPALIVAASIVIFFIKKIAKSV